MPGNRRFLKHFYRSRLTVRFCFGRRYSPDENATHCINLIFSVTPWIQCLWQRIKSIRLYDFVTVESFPHSRNKSQATQKPIMHSWYVNHSRIKFNNSNETKSTWQISNNAVEHFFYLQLLRLTGMAESWCAESCRKTLWILLLLLCNKKQPLSRKHLLSSHCSHWQLKAVHSKLFSLFHQLWSLFLWYSMQCTTSSCWSICGAYMLALINKEVNNNRQKSRSIRFLFPITCICLKGG